MVPATGEAPCCTLNVVPLSVPGSIAALKVTAIFTLSATPEPLLEGIVEVMVGAAPAPMPGPGFGFESLPHAARTELMRKAQNRRVLRSETMEVLQPNETRLWRGDYLSNVRLIRGLSKAPSILHWQSVAPRPTGAHLLARLFLVQVTTSANKLLGTLPCARGGGCGGADGVCHVRCSWHPPMRAAKAEHGTRYAFR